MRDEEPGGEKGGAAFQVPVGAHECRRCLRCAHKCRPALVSIQALNKKAGQHSASFIRIGPT
eukprot:2869948-Ditylum_brightwellii.AAC.1